MNRFERTGRMRASGLLLLLALVSAVVFFVLRLRECRDGDRAAPEIHNNVKSSNRTR